MLSIHHIEHPFQKLDTVRILFAEYADELGEDLEFQHFEEELKDPLQKYGPPDGSLLELFGTMSQPAALHYSLCQKTKKFAK